jgi:S-DNA-T family DNA segregation ATPase FtsK/SpoIIIE
MTTGKTTGPQRVRFVVRTPDGDTPLVATVRRAEATVADLIDAVADHLLPDRSTAPRLELRIGDEALDHAAPVTSSGLTEGGLVTLARAGDHAGCRARSHPTMPFNRPPRPALPPPTPAVDLPTPPVHTAAAPLGLAGIVVPLVLAGVLATVLDNAVWALLSLLGPAALVAGWAEQRRRGRGDRRRGQRRWRHELCTLADALGRAARHERDRRRTSLVSIEDTLARASAVASSLWERRPGDRDWLKLSIGSGLVGWSVPVEREPEATEIAAMLAAAATLPDTPVALDLAGGAVVGLVGDRTATVAAARSLLLQAAVHHGPADLAAAVVTDSGAAPEWDWARWLPHVADPASGEPCTAATPTKADELAGELARRPDPSPALLLVVDDDELRTHRRSAVRMTLHAHNSAISAIVVARRAEDLPSACSTVVTMDATGGARLERRGRGADQPPAWFQPTALGTHPAVVAARGLAGLEDPLQTGATSGSLGPPPSLATLLGLVPPTPAAIAARWRTADPEAPPATVIGIGSDGPISIDLAADGPHGLIAGTTDRARASC